MRLHGILETVCARGARGRTRKRWSLTGNGDVLVKSFYNFLIDGGTRCPVAKFFWHCACPRKINLFNWLAWKNKILSLDNLVLRKCNKLPTATCVMCHSDIETVDHLFLTCSFTRRIWDYFTHLFRLPEPPGLMSSLWGPWRLAVQPAARDFCDLLVKALVWNVWLVRNDIIFNATVVPVFAIILKIDRMLLSWFSNCSVNFIGKIEEPMKSISHSLEFIGSRSVGATSEVGSDATPAAEVQLLSSE
ncbi:uncharacterized protein LOC120270217 [Dioscorea cayenensis subsp. rotundata]|uniref:Uncharacterized protein LOC120270217 n=1 Tax=Dioscorea cayennensis subsp. rotundata TaxID=55577 RepID=A0AB40C0B2_DIOCR|nr:uncharacterized protein LOC120270217 [Dioscorea cayenensis subsp. rotundata]